MNLSSVCTLRRWRKKLRRMLTSLWRENPSTETWTSKSIALMRLRKKLCSRNHKSSTPAFHTAKTACSYEGHQTRLSDVVKDVVLIWNPQNIIIKTLWTMLIIICKNLEDWLLLLNFPFLHRCLIVRDNALKRIFDLWLIKVIRPLFFIKNVMSTLVLVFIFR